MMKIGIVCPYDIFKGGGVQESVIALEEKFRERGHSVTVIAPRLRKTTESPIKDLQLLGGAADFKSPFSTTFQVSAAVSIKDIDSLLKEKAFDVMHFHEPWVPMLSKQVLSRSKSINVGTFHAKSPEDLISRTAQRVMTPYGKSVIKNLNMVTAVSEAASQNIRSLGFEPVIVPNGIDLSKYKNNEKLKKQSNTILYIGRLEKRKGVKYLIKAFMKLQAQLPDSQLRIIGEGPDRKKLEEYIKTKRINNVTFLGYVSEKEKIKELQQASLFCSPAMFGESFGIVLLEAMAVGTPVVAGNNQGYASVLTADGKKSLVDSTNTIQLKEKLLQFLTNEKLRKFWLAWAASEIKQYDYDLIAKSYEKVFEQAVKRDKKILS